jgi:hypothetical protein
MPRSAGSGGVSFPPATVHRFVCREKQYTFWRVALGAVSIEGYILTLTFLIHIHPRLVSALSGRPLVAIHRVKFSQGKCPGRARDLAPPLAAIRRGLTHHRYDSALRT